MWHPVKHITAMWLMLCVQHTMKIMMVMVMVGQHHWPALSAPLASSTGHHHWSAPLAGNIGQDPWQHVTNTSVMTMLMMLMMMIMATMTIMIMMLIMLLIMMMMMMMMLMGMIVVGMCVCLCVCCVCVRAEQNHRAAPLPAPLASIITTSGQHHWPTPLTSRIDVKYWIGCMIQPENQETQKCSTI
jgi:hypothetical protein